MITHFLGQEQVRAYCKDFAGRIACLGDRAPVIWCPVGFSGREIHKIIGQHLRESHPALSDRILLQPLTYQKPHNGRAGSVSVVPRQGQSEKDAVLDLQTALVKCPSALVIDSSVHSGSSMLGAVDFLERLGATEVVTYSLVIKQSSGFIPHYFGLVVGDHDRAVFLLDSIPNNRLAKPGTSLKGVMRKLTAADVNSTDKVDSGVESISKIGWGDLWYDVNAHKYSVYVVRCAGTLAGFVKYKVDPHCQMMLDVIAVNTKHQGSGVGAALFRWAETIARTSSCHSISLWGIENLVANYEKAGYRKSGPLIDTGGNEKYQFMTKPLLYHFDLKEMVER